MSRSQRRSALAWAVALLGCSCSSAAPTGAPERAEAPAERVVLSETIDEPPRVSPPTTGPDPGPEDSGRAGAGFVLYGEALTLVVPLEPSQALIQADGHWILDEDTARVRHIARLSAEDLGVAGVPPCPCGVLAAEADVCVLEEGALVLERLVEREGERVVAGRAPCSCWLAGRDPMRAQSSSEHVATSIVGDRLERLSIDHSWGVLNEYDALVSRVWLGAGAIEEREQRRGTLVGCTHDVDARSRPWPLPALSREGCDVEPGVIEAELHLLRRGQLYTLGYSVSGAGDSLWVWRTPAGPGSCESPADPCGDPGSFAELASGDERWIEPGAAHALVGRADRIRIEAPSGQVLRQAEVGLDLTRDVIGVRYHTDVSSLVAAMQRGVELRAEPSDRGSACVEDADCARSGLCGAGCADGACVEGARAACPDGFVLVEGWCIATSRDAPSGSRGRERGEDCAEALAARQLGRAERLCAEGLAAATDPGVRGALLYNLGRIHEARGLWPQAREAYLRSLDVRGDHPVVRERLHALPDAGPR